MRIGTKGALWLLIALLLLFAALPVLADGEESVKPLQIPDVRCLPAEGEAGWAVSLQEADGALYLFLPASADLTALRLEFPGETALLRAGETELSLVSGEAADLSALLTTPEEGCALVLIPARAEEAEEAEETAEAEETGETEETAEPEETEQAEETADSEIAFTLLRGSNVASMFLTSPDAEHDRTWVEQDKSNKAKKGDLLLLDADGSALYDGKLKNIKGRGNSTWALPKKPYQIKLAVETDLIGTGDPLEAEETWVLLADFADTTHLHNRVSFDLAAALGMDFTPNCRPVDLWYDGEYRGSYLLSEKTEVSDGRVAVNDLDAATEEANPDLDFDTLDTARGVNAYGNRYQYVSGLALPEDYSAGYLLELDYYDRAMEELCWFETSHGDYVVVKSPEYFGDEGVRYISERYQRFEDAVYAGDAEALAAEADLVSLARNYLMLEFAMDTDAYSSSTYFHLGEGKLENGPVWDFDIAYSLSPNGYYAAVCPLVRAMLAIPAFRDTVMEEEARLYELVDGTLLSSDPAAATGRLRSLAGYQQEIAQTYRMDLLLWPNVISGIDWDQVTAKLGAEAEIAAFADYLRQRADWLHQTVSAWSETDSPALPRFLDVPVDAAYYADVEYTAERGILKGISATQFDPYGYMTRAMVVTVLHRLSGSPAATESAPFQDVAADAWYADAVAWGAEQGIVVGYEGNVFLPGAPISRQEFIAFLYRSVGSPAHTGELNYADAEAVADWAGDAVRWAVETGVYLDPYTVPAAEDEAETAPAEYLLSAEPSYRLEAAVILSRYCRLALMMK